MPNVKLWPKAEYTPWLAPGAVAQAEAEYGKGLDRGALRDGENGTEILWAGGNWIPYQPGNPKHITAANTYNRIGVGWSAGYNSDNLHSTARGYYEKVHGSLPGPYSILNVDLGFDERLFRELQRQATGGSGDTPKEPVGAIDPTLADRLDDVDGMLRRIVAKLGA